MQRLKVVVTKAGVHKFTVKLTFLWISKDNEVSWRLCRPFFSRSGGSQM